jgi:SAM-dependent methyltransferase
MTAAVYQGYDDWKGWSSDRFFRCSDRQRAYYAGELAGIKLDGARVLEIGFGNGEFLCYAREKGATILGTELLEELVTLARQQGLEFVGTSVDDLAGLADRSLDLIVGFDVMEHLTLEENVQLLAEAGRLLRKDGRFIARFPNGQSPFGRVYQHGDHTHRSTLSTSIIVQLLPGTALELVSARNQFLPALGNPLRRALVGVKHGLRSAVEKAIATIYDFRFPLGPNLVIELRPKTAGGA